MPESPHPSWLANVDLPLSWVEGLRGEESPTGLLKEYGRSSSMKMTNSYQGLARRDRNKPTCNKRTFFTVNLCAAFLILQRDKQLCQIQADARVLIYLVA